MLCPLIVQECTMVLDTVSHYRETFILLSIVDQAIGYKRQYGIIDLQGFMAWQSVVLFLLRNGLY